MKLHQPKPKVSSERGLVRLQAADASGLSETRPWARDSCDVGRAAWESPPVRARVPDRWDMCSAPSATTLYTETHTHTDQSA